jgi:hypothetical protein
VCCCCCCCITQERIALLPYRRPEAESAHSLRQDSVACERASSSSVRFLVPAELELCACVKDKTEQHPHSTHALRWQVAPCIPGSQIRCCLTAAACAQTCHSAGLATSTHSSTSKQLP